MNIFSLGATNTIGSTSTQQFSPPPGINFQGFTTKGNLNTPATIQSYSLSNALNLFFFRPDLDLGATIQALEVKGILQVLAEPNVLAENGKQASFLAGGEFPFPTVQGIGGGSGAGAVTIQFKQFGIRLNFIPTLAPNGTIHLQVAPEVSSLDFTNGLTIQGFNVPALTVRRVNTEIDLSEGQSFAIGGLLDNSVTETYEKVPFIGDVPILGKFFQSRSRTKQNTELLVIVTPEIVKPIPAGQPLEGACAPRRAVLSPSRSSRRGRRFHQACPRVLRRRGRTPRLANPSRRRRLSRQSRCDHGGRARRPPRALCRLGIRCP
jgi:pilus assembly protein CpaC